MSNRPLKFSLLGATAVACLVGCSGATAEPAPGLLVSPRGLDSNAGSESAPFRSLKQALLVAKPGDTVRLENGTYDAADGETWDYAAAAGVTISGESAEQTLLQAPLPDGGFVPDMPVAAESQVIALQASSKLTLQNLSLVGFYQGLEFTAPAQVALRHVVIRDGITALQILASDCQVELEDTTLSILEGEGSALKLIDTSQGGQISLKRATVTGGVFVAGADAKLSIDDSTLDGNSKNAAVNFAGATLEIAGSRLRSAAAPYAISMHGGALSLEGTSVEGGNYALYQLGGSSKLRNTQLLNYASIGLYFAAGNLDLGTAIEAGNNSLTDRGGGTEALGIYVDTGTAPVTSSNTSFDGVVPPAGTVQAGVDEIVAPGEYFITPGQSMQFFDVPAR